MGHPGWDLVRRYRVHAALSGLLLAAALGSSPAHALCTSAGSSSTVCVVTDANEGPGTAANPTLRYAITEAINSGYTTVVTVNTGTLATISGAPFDLGGVAFGGNGGIRIDGPFGASSPQTFSVAGPALSFGSSATGTGSTLTFNADFSAGNLSLGNPVVLNRILSVTNSGQAHFDFLTVGASGSVALASRSTLSIGMVCPTFGSCISQLNGSFGGIFGAGDLVKTGTSRINMNVANTYSGSTTIEDGVLLLSLIHI